jgi:hypothetical protein
MVIDLVYIEDLDESIRLMKDTREFSHTMIRFLIHIFFNQLLPMDKTILLEL